ncbi:MAG: DUF945 family protein [Pseudomonadales bacterium]|nr:DUF945 family protein [Pseudomonadales bacterium]
MINRILQLFLVLSVGIVLFFGVTPKIIGLGIRDATVTSLINLVPPESQGQVRITESQFDNGWFSSTATIDIGLVALGMDDSLTAKLDLEIEHGPFFLTDEGPRMGLARARIIPGFNSQELTQALTEIPFEIPSVDISMFVPFDQSLTVDLDVAPVNYNQDDGVVTFAGMNGNLSVNADQSAQLSISVGNMFAQDNESQIGFTLAGIEVESHTAQMNDLLAPSSVLLAIPAISATGPFAFNVTDMSSNARMQASTIPQAIDIYQDLRIGNIESDLPVQSLSWTAEFNEIQNELFRSYYELIGTIQSQMNTNPSAVMTTADQFGEDMALLFIQNSLVLNNLVQANVYGGDHSIDFRIDWEGLPDLTDLENPEFEELANALAILIEMSFDERAIMSSQFAEMVDPYVQEGYFVVENGRIMLSASLENGVLSVNGEEVPIDQFF